MLDTSILILRRWIDPDELPDEMAISAVTLAELSAGPHEVRRNDESRGGRARRVPWPGTCTVNHGGLRDRAPGTAGEPDCGDKPRLVPGQAESADA